MAGFLFLMLNTTSTPKLFLEQAINSDVACLLISTRQPLYASGVVKIHPKRWQ
jgi:hypothetical protein